MPDIFRGATKSEIKARDAGRYGVPILLAGAHLQVRNARHLIGSSKLTDQEVELLKNLLAETQDVLVSCSSKDETYA
jgi:hypothetical protein